MCKVQCLAWRKHSLNSYFSCYLLEGFHGGGARELPMPPPEGNSKDRRLYPLLEHRKVSQGSRTWPVQWAMSRLSQLSGDGAGLG